MMYFASESTVTLTVLLTILVVLALVVMIGIIVTKRKVIKKKPGTDIKVEG